MQKTIAGFAMLMTIGLFACSTAPPVPTSTVVADQGDRELSHGVNWYNQGCIEKAMEHFYAAHEFYSLTDQQAGVARSLISLANLYRQADNPKNAMLFYDAAIAAARQSDDRPAMVQALSAKAGALIDGDQLDSAVALLDEAVQLSSKNNAAYATLLTHQAVLMMKQENYNQALERLDKAQWQGGSGPAAAAIRYTRGRIKMKTGDQTAALDLFQEALALDRKTGFKRGMADDLLAMADLHEKAGRPSEALACLERGLKIHALIGNRKSVRNQLARLKTLAAEAGADVRVSLHFLQQWLSGEGLDVVCY